MCPLFILPMCPLFIPPPPTHPPPQQDGVIESKPHGHSDVHTLMHQVPPATRPRTQRRLRDAGREPDDGPGSDSASDGALRGCGGILTPPPLAAAPDAVRGRPVLKCAACGAAAARRRRRLPARSAPSRSWLNALLAAARGGGS